MIRKIRFRVEASTSVFALVSLLHIHEHYDNELELLCSDKEAKQLERGRRLLRKKQQAMTETFSEVRERFEQIKELASELKLLEQQHPLKEVLGFQGFQVSFDLRELFEEHDEEAVELLLLVSTLLGEPDWFQAHVYLGRRRSDLHQLLLLLYRYARTYEYFGASEEQEEAGEENSQKQRQKREQGKKKQGRDKQGGNRQQREQRKNKEQRKGKGRAGSNLPFSEVAEFFLNYVSLSWPCTRRDLTKAYKRAIYQTHPDRNPLDRNAVARTQLLNAGYAELRQHALDDSREHP